MKKNGILLHLKFAAEVVAGGATGGGGDDVTRGAVLGVKRLEAGLGGDVVIGPVVTTRGGSVDEGAGRAVEVAAEEGARED